MPSQKWLNTAAFLAHRAMCGEDRPVIDGKPYPPFWWMEKKIRIFCEEGISSQTIRIVQQAINQRFSEVGHEPFDFEIWGVHQSAQEQIKASMVNGQLDENKLFRICASEPWRDKAKGGIQHGDIFITRRQFLNDTVSWGAADFKFGVMILALHGSRQTSTDFLRRVVLHEATHLVGYGYHCDQWKEVEGYLYDSNCSMHYSCHGEHLCDKCNDFIGAWWERILKIAYV